MLKWEWAASMEVGANMYLATTTIYFLESQCGRTMVLLFMLSLDGLFHFAYGALIARQAMLDTPAAQCANSFCKESTNAARQLRSPRVLGQRAVAYTPPSSGHTAGKSAPFTWAPEQPKHQAEGGG